MLTTMDVIFQHPESCLALDSSAECFLCLCSCKPVPLHTPWLACIPLELCPLVLNIQRQILQMDLSCISSLLYFQVFNLQCFQDTVWLPEIFWSLKTLLTCSRFEALYATHRQAWPMKESAFSIAFAGSANTGNYTVPEDRPRH